MAAPLLIAGLAAGGLAGGAGIGALAARRGQRKLDESVAGKALKAEEEAVAERQRTGQYGKSEAERRQDIREISEPARVETDRQLSLLSGLRRGGAGRSGAADRQATQLAKGLAQTQAEAGKAAAQISQKAAEQQKLSDLAFIDKAMKRKMAQLAARRAAITTGATLGLKTGAAVGSGLESGALGTTESALS